MKLQNPRVMLCCLHSEIVINMVKYNTDYTSRLLYAEVIAELVR